MAMLNNQRVKDHEFSAKIIKTMAVGEPPTIKKYGDFDFEFTKL